jgi:ribosomal protein S12 methylthiotransferase accessory factor
MTSGHLRHARIGPVTLAAGHHLYPGPDGSWRVSQPDGRFLRVDAPDSLLRRLASVLEATAPVEPLAAEAPDDEAFAELLDTLERRGLLVGAVPDDGGPPDDHVVVIEGGNPVAQLTADLLAEHATMVHGPVDRRGLAGVDLLISCAGWLPDARWQEVDRWCWEQDVPWHRCYAEGLLLYVGPLSLPGRTARYADTRARQLAAAGLPDELLAYWKYLDGAAGLPAVRWPSPGSAALVAGLLVTDALACLARRPIPSEGYQLCVDPSQPSIRRHPVLPLPELNGPPRVRARPGGAMHAAGNTAAGWQQLVDPRLGLIRQVVRQPSTLRACVCYGAQVSSTGRFGPWTADRTTGGATIGDEQGARNAALGEAVERYCGNAVPKELLTSSFARLRSAGRRAVDPRDVVLYAPRQYRTPGFPFVPMAHDLALAWVPGRDLASDEEILVPASLVYLNYFQGGHAGEPRTNFQISAGIAAGETLERAERSALEELFERDATMIWWVSGAPAFALDLTDEPVLSPALAEARACGLVVSFIRIPCSFGVSVVGAFIQDPARTIIAFGTACRATIEAAAAKAFTEAVVTHTMSLELLDAGSTFWAAVDSGLLPRHPYRPYRQDRAYRNEFRDDWRELCDLRMHVQLYLDPRMQRGPCRRIGAATRAETQRAATSLPGVDARQVYLAQLAARGYRAIAVDLTTSDVRAAGLSVVRVVVPGLYDTAPAAFLPLGGRRLYEEPGAQGWLPGTISEADLDLCPLPTA